MATDSDPAALGPHELLLHLHADLAPWVAARKGTLSLAGNPGEVLEQLTEAPKSFRVVLAWGGDADQTGEAEAGIVDNTLEVWLMKPRGMKVTPGKQLVAAPAGEVPTLSLLSDLRKRVRSLAWPEEVTYGRLLYKGARPYPNPELAYELPTTGFRLTFELTTAVPWEELREE